jgi:hypothetical protein
MRAKPILQTGAPLLLPGARIDRRPGTDMPILELPTGSILLSEGAAAVLRLCTGRHSRTEIRLRLEVLGHSQSGTFIEEFLDAARDRNWVVDLRLPAIRSSVVAECAEH